MEKSIFEFYCNSTNEKVVILAQLDNGYFEVKNEVGIIYNVHCNRIQPLN